MCTFFRIQDGERYQIGKNYDVPSPCYGLLFWNPAGVKKKALLRPPEKPAKWISKYGSISFNQVGRDFPACGMNEKALVVEQTNLWNTLYPDKDKRDAMNELQLIQYLLDLCSTTREALEYMAKVRVSQETAKLQYILSDAKGDICLVEFILGDMKVYYNQAFSYQVITNDMMETSLDYLKIHSGFGGEKAIKPGKYSLDRYVITVNALQEELKQKAVSDGIELLDKSKYEDTQWQIIYEPDLDCIKWRTKDSTSIHQISLKDFIHKKECVTIETDSMVQNPYRKSRNLLLVNRFFRESAYFNAVKIKDSDIDLIASVPEKSML